MYSARVSTSCGQEAGLLTKKGKKIPSRGRSASFVKEGASASAVRRIWGAWVVGWRNLDTCNFPVGLPPAKEPSNIPKTKLSGGFLCGKPAGKLLVDVVAHFVEQHAHMVNI